MQSLEDLLRMAPGTRTEKDWIEALHFIVDALEHKTGNIIEIGEYWIDDEMNHGSLGAEIRSWRGLPSVTSDSWEAVLCVTFSDARIWSDVFTFPFLAGSRVTKRGRIEASETEFDEFWWFQWSDNQWQDRGWDEPEGAGEWAFVRKPGDIYRETLNCHPSQAEFEIGKPLLLDVALGKQEISLQDSAGRSDRDVGVAYFSLITVKRDKRPGHMGPWSPRIPHHQQSHVVRVSRFRDTKTKRVTLDLSAWKIRHGWRTGKYYAILRMQGAFLPGGNWNYTSSVSAPFRFRIVDER